MQCPTASERMSLRLDGALSEEESRELDEHMLSCAACRREWELMQRASAAFEGVEMVAPPTDFSARLMRRVQRRSTWLAILRGGLAVLLVGVLVMALVAVPLRLLYSLSETVAGTPSLISTLVGVLTRWVQVARTMLDAMQLTLHAVLTSPTGMLVLGYVLVCAIVVVGWAKLALLPRRVGR